jgi:hypothetical protein
MSEIPNLSHLITPVPIAWCPEHGLHGQRSECHESGGPVEQVQMVHLTENEARGLVLASIFGTPHPVPLEIESARAKLRPLYRNTEL